MDVMVEPQHHCLTAIEQEVLCEAVRSLDEKIIRLPVSSEWHWAFLAAREEIAAVVGLPARNAEPSSRRLALIHEGRPMARLRVVSTS